MQQSGSRVDDRSLRFDFTHFRALEREQIAKVEKIVNEWVLEDLPVTTVIRDPETAKREGAMALFGEKYGDKVRVVSMGAVSKELCGGTHVASTGRIGLFHITEETSISAGVRRMEAITGLATLTAYQGDEEILAQACRLFKTNKGALLERLKSTLDTIAGLQAQVADLSATQAKLQVGLILETALAQEGGLKWTVHNLGTVDKKSFNDIFNAVSDEIREKKIEQAAIVIAGVAEGAVMIAAYAGNEAVRKFGIHCGEIVKAASGIVSGSGGGSPSRAQAGGKDPSKLGEAVAAAVRLISAKVKATS